MRVATHNGVFHSDEVFAVALLKLAGEEVEVTRLPHQTDVIVLDEFDLVIDIGRRYDGVKYFDHHQGGTGEKASAGLILHYLEGSGKLPVVDDIREIIGLVDRQDNGIERRPLDSITSVISNLNTNDIYGEEQNAAFNKAVAFAEELVLAPLLKKHIEAEEEMKVLEKIQLRTVVLLPGHMRHWQKVFNSVINPDVEAVVWEDDKAGDWKIQVAPVEPGSFERVGRGLEPRDYMKFVHAGQFFAVAPDRASMERYVRDIFDAPL
jgi:uncharacterized UPF0160 family protein